MSSIATIMELIMSLNEINLNNPLPFFEGLYFSVDAFNEHKQIDSVMPIFQEEQPITWELYKNELWQFVSERSKIRILDVGCGSGFWGLLLKSKFPSSEIVCIDKNPLAIKRTQYNAQMNKLEVSTIESLYDRDLFEDHSFDIIVITAPYHLYDPADSEHIPLFARGGEYGLQEFYSQIKIAIHHLMSGGMILFNQMSAGTDVPDYVSFFKNTFGVGKLEYTNILPPISTLAFLEGLYGKLRSRYLKSFAGKMPTLFYTSGLFLKREDDFSFIDNTGTKKDILSKISSDWQVRIELHKGINGF